MYCGTCGTQNNSNTQFCGGCGNAISQNTIINNQQQTPPLPVAPVAQNMEAVQQPVENSIPVDPNMMQNHQMNGMQAQPMNHTEQFMNNMQQQAMPVAPQNPIYPQMPFNQPINYQQTNPNKPYFIAGAVVLGVLLFVGMIILSINDSSGFHFTDDPHVEETGSPSPSGSSTTPGMTVIQYDNQLFGLAGIDHANALRLIVEDSMNQKSTCDRRIVEIEERIVQNYRITATNLCEVNYDLAIEMENMIRYLHRDFPSAMGHLTNLTLFNASISLNPIAFYMPAFEFGFPQDRNNPTILKMIMGLNTKYFLNPSYLERSLERGAAQGHFPPNTNAGSIIAHEFAHYLSFVVSMRANNVDSLLLFDSQTERAIWAAINDFFDGVQGKEMIEEAYQNYRTKTNTSMSFTEFRASISRYAVAKDNNGNYIYDETIAEAFSDVYTNGDNAAPASIEIFEVLKRRLN
jgi:hypothetical protein